MKRNFVAALTLALTLAFALQPASAQNGNNSNNSWDAFWSWITHGQDPRLVGVGIALGIGTGLASYFATEKHGNPGVRHVSFGTAYAVTGFGCAVVYPIAGTLVLNRPLTPREMYIGTAECFLPVIGGWIVDAALPHDAWTDGTPPKRVRYAHNHK